MRATRAEVLGRLQAPLTGKLDALVRGAALADNHVGFTYDWPAGSLAFDLRDGVGDAVIVMRDDVDERPPPELRFARLGFDPVRIARQFLELAADRTDYIALDKPGGYLEQLEQLVRSRIAVLVYLDKVRLPRLEGSSQYVGGLLSGAALVVDLEELRFCGGVEFGAGSSWEVRAKEDLVAHVLVDDLARHFGDAVKTKLAQRFPDAQLPLTFGY